MTSPPITLDPDEQAYLDADPAHYLLVARVIADGEEIQHIATYLDRAPRPIGNSPQTIDLDGLLVMGHRIAPVTVDKRNRVAAIDFSAGLRSVERKTVVRDGTDRIAEVRSETYELADPEPRYSADQVRATAQDAAAQGAQHGAAAERQRIARQLENGRDA